jgi:hypothetical protein
MAREAAAVAAILSYGSLAVGVRKRPTNTRNTITSDQARENTMTQVKRMVSEQNTITQSIMTTATVP